MSLLLLKSGLICGRGMSTALFLQWAIESQRGFGAAIIGPIQILKSPGETTIDPLQINGEDQQFSKTSQLHKGPLLVRSWTRAWGQSSKSRNFNHEISSEFSVLWGQCLGPLGPGALAPGKRTGLVWMVSPTSACRLDLTSESKEERDLGGGGRFLGPARVANEDLVPKSRLCHGQNLTPIKQQSA
ncbi:hypothetical protein BDFG_01856 [Blastomyces dermatitidis ATCC 26199]|nr:hypothetical protein BDFG_01856 [Blastomyces dermatitidis ATCC 26199]